MLVLHQILSCRSHSSFVSFSEILHTENLNCLSFKKNTKFEVELVKTLMKLNKEELRNYSFISSTHLATRKSAPILLSQNWLSLNVWLTVIVSNRAKLFLYNIGLWLWLHKVWLEANSKLSHQTNTHHIIEVSRYLNLLSRWSYSQLVDSDKKSHCDHSWMRVGFGSWILVIIGGVIAPLSAIAVTSSAGHVVLLIWSAYGGQGAQLESDKASDWLMTITGCSLATDAPLPPYPELSGPPKPIPPLGGIL